MYLTTAQVLLLVSAASVTGGLRTLGLFCYAAVQLCSGSSLPLRCVVIKGARVSCMPQKAWVVA